MIHAREDYMRIQEPAQLLESLKNLIVITEVLGKTRYMSQERRAQIEEAKSIAAHYDSLPPVANPIGEDEPVFLLRAKDQFMPEIVFTYASHCRSLRLPQADMITAFSRAARHWQAENGKKVPDVPEQFILEL